MMDLGGIVALLLLMLIPWPGPTVFKISCPRDSARIVRKLVQKKWLPVLEKRSVKLGLECPFHPSRDIFGAQQAAKQQHRASQWACAFCGKSFYTERHLDQHFDSRHRDSINMAEDAVCLADYCDVMRCEVLAAREAHGPSLGGTDIEVWRSSTHQAGMAHRTALSVSAPRDLARVTAFPSLKAPQGRKAQQQQPPTQPQTPRCAPIPGGGARGATGSREREGDAQGDANATADMCDKGQTLVDSSVPPAPQQQQQQRLSEMQRFKADCKPEELSKLKTRCELLVRDCIAGLLVNLSVQDFKEIEEELNRASCWYLTCDRYWEDSPPEARASPWTLLALMGAMLAVGVVVCYYIIWVLFDSSQEPWCDSPGLAPRDARDGRGPHGPGGPGGPGGYGPYGPQAARGPHAGDDPYGHPSHPDDPVQYHGEMDGDQYIYVTYPPELKRRLLERPAPTQPTPVPTTAHQYHHQLHHHQVSQPIMTPIMSHHHHYPMHHSPHMSHMQHAGPLAGQLAGQHAGQHSPHAGQHVPRGSPMGRGAHQAHQGSPKQQEPNPYEREWRI
ncbi:uncharacterized protein LOC117643147 isoform X2 [Thrips palmi]|uniref:Uncharacterized protein LOC117643147 isoform X2 n=1 Tax=Thrips palmi TaxID=161013 RepID=A0A6P8YDI2_THRPL|nr:uncharacterized protein LOC117643147 isoform X2 [Thrips palmi]